MRIEMLTLTWTREELPCTVSIERPWKDGIHQRRCRLLYCQLDREAPGTRGSSTISLRDFFLVPTKIPEVGEMWLWSSCPSLFFNLRLLAHHWGLLFPSQVWLSSFLQSGFTKH